MKVFVFGAGASRGSQDYPGGHGQDDASLSERTSPLVNELFEGAYSHHGRLIGLTGAIMDEVRKGVAARGVEGWLTSEWESIHRLPAAAKQAKRDLFGRFAFYLWSLFLEVSQSYDDDHNGYRLFIDKLLKYENFGLISFNYDLLLDRAIQHRAGNRLASLDNYLGFNYVKPHGSVNWFISPRRDDPELDPLTRFDPIVTLRNAASQMFTGGALDTAGFIVLPPDYRTFLGSYEAFHQVRDRFGYYFYPLVIMPLTIKAYGFLVEFQKILDRARAVIAQANEVYLIGYHAADEVIRELLANPPVRSGTLLHVVGRNEYSAREIQERVLGFATALRPGKIFGVGFMRFVRELL